jgi:hypothetical protein
VSLLRGRMSELTALSHPQALLDQLASHTFHSAASPTSLLLSCAALAYHAHLQFARVGFLERVGGES